MTLSSLLGSDPMFCHYDWWSKLLRSCYFYLITQSGGWGGRGVIYPTSQIIMHTGYFINFNNPIEIHQFNFLVF